MSLIQQLLIPAYAIGAVVGALALAYTLLIGHPPELLAPTVLAGTVGGFGLGFLSVLCGYAIGRLWSSINDWIND